MTGRGDGDGAGGDPAEGGWAGAARWKVCALAVALVLAVGVARGRSAQAVARVPELGGVVALVVSALGLGALVGGLVLLAGGRRRAPAVVEGVHQERRRLASFERWRRRRAIRAVLVGVAVAVCYLVASRLLGPSARGGPRPEGGTYDPNRPDGGGLFVTDPGSPASGVVSPGTGIVLAVVVIAVAVYALARRRAAPAVDQAGDAEASVIARAVTAARAAVSDREISDPRRAVVACFEAMEGTLSRLGEELRPREADTPLEVVGRAVRGAGMPEAPSQTLLSLFHRAQFSTHPMSPADREAADQALGAMLSALPASSRGGGGR